MTTDKDQVDFDTLAAVIAHSPIIVPSVSCRPSLPAGFDDVDRAILEWIANEARHVSRSLVRM